MSVDSICVCGSLKLYKNCCKPFHDNTKTILVTEELLRARYSAFILRFPDFIQSTMAEPSSEHFDSEFILNSPIRWENLKINSVEKGGEDDDEGIIDFTITYREAEFSSKQAKMREKSLFKRIDGNWFYVDALSLKK